MNAVTFPVMQLHSLVDIIETDALAAAHVTYLNVMPEPAKRFLCHSAAVILHVDDQKLLPRRIRRLTVNTES